MTFTFGFALEVSFFLLLVFFLDWADLPLNPLSGFLPPGDDLPPPLNTTPAITTPTTMAETINIFLVLIPLLDASCVAIRDLVFVF